MPAGYTTVTGSNFTDASDNPLSGATIWFQPCDTAGTPLSFCVNGAGQATKKKKKATVTNGAFSILLADTSLTLPINICYQVTLTDNISGESLLSQGYLIQPRGPTWNIDPFEAESSPLALIQPGPPGPTGPANTLTILAVTTLAPGSAATATIAGSAPNQSLSLGIPQGVPGPVGGNLATTTPQADVAGGAVGDSESSARANHAHPFPAALVALSGALIQDIISNYSGLPVDLVLACDAQGNLALYSDTSGNVVAGLSLTAPLVATSKLNFIFGTTIEETIQELASSFYDIDTVLVSDARKNLALFSTKEGDIVVGRNLIVTGELTAANMSTYPSSVQEDALGNVYYAATDASNKMQIVQVSPAGVTTYLTSGSNNWMPTVRGGLVLFLSDRAGSGTTTPYQMRLYGQDQQPLASSLLKPWMLEHIIVYGQSLSTGFYGTPILDSTQPYNNLTWNGTDTTNDNGVHATVTNVTAFGPLVESVANSSPIIGETVCSSMCNGLTLDLLGQGVSAQFLSQAAGLGGTAYAGLARGTVHYNLVLSSVTEALALATAAGETYGVGCIPLIHGQSDEGTALATYYADLLTWQANFQTDIQAISAQKQTIPILISQANEFGSYPSTGKLEGTSGLAQLQACENYPGLFYFVSPQYFLPHYTDGLHLVSQSYRILGDYFRKTIKAIKLGQFWTGLRPRSLQLIGTTLVVRFWVPVAPIVIDTAAVTEPTELVAGQKYGFYIESAGGVIGTPAITAIAISAPDTLTMTLSAAPAAGSFLAYANNVKALSTGTQPTSGPRGNLRDSDSTPSYYTPATLLYNWCAAFKKQIN
jgi:hypothetical protein